jgi:hypothetical protein
LATKALALIHAESVGDVEVAELLLFLDLLQDAQIVGISGLSIAGHRGADGGGDPHQYKDLAEDAEWPKGTCGDKASNRQRDVAKPNGKRSHNLP